MGCPVSKISVTCDPTDSLPDDDRSKLNWTNSLLTETQKTIIYSTWRHLSDNTANTGMRVFRFIFTLHPDVRNLFKYQHLETSELSTNTYFRGHALHCMEPISKAVDNLDDLEAKLTPLLLAQGEQHSKTEGFGIQHFEVFTQCLILVWEERLEDKFTAEVKASWEKLFVFILMTLREGWVDARVSQDGDECITQVPDNQDEKYNYENTRMEHDYGTASTNSG